MDKQKEKIASAELEVFCKYPPKQYNKKELDTLFYLIIALIGSLNFFTAFVFLFKFNYLLNLYVLAFMGFFLFFASIFMLLKMVYLNGRRSK